MPDNVLEITTDAGVMPVHITRPRGSGPFPLIVMYMDAPGVRGDLHEAAARLAGAGCLVALPDLYYRVDPDLRPDPKRPRGSDEEERARMMSAIRSISDPDVLADTELMLAELRAREPIGADGWGCIGFCMGARIGLRAAAHFGEAMRAASLLHPAALVTDSPDSPHRHVATVRASLYLGYGEKDQVSPPSSIPPLREELELHHVPHRFEVFPDAAHGFMMPSHGGYNREAAERAWKGTFELLGRALPATA
jgi:carboxymethylenebutenolidase